MLFSFFIWYSLGPPAAGRERGRKKRGTPPLPRPWDCVPRHPLSSCRLRRAGNEGRKRRECPPRPRPWDYVPGTPC